MSLPILPVSVEAISICLYMTLIYISTMTLTAARQNALGAAFLLIIIMANLAGLGWSVKAWFSLP